MDEKIKTTVSIFYYCENSNKFKKLKKLLNEITTQGAYFFDKLYVASNTIINESSFGNFEYEQKQISETESLPQIWNNFAKTSNSQFFLFLRDEVSALKKKDLILLLDSLRCSDYAAISPRTYARKERQNIYHGQKFTQSFFEGFPIVDYMGVPTKEPYSRGIPKETVVPTQTLSSDIFMIRADCFHYIEGFDANNHYYFTLDLACKLNKINKVIGYMPELIFKLPKMRDNIGTITQDMASLLTVHGALFSEIDENEDLYRAVICPSNMDYLQSKKKKVFLCHHELSFTGAPTVLFDMGIALREIGFDVIFGAAKNGSFGKKIIESGFPLIIDSALGSGRFLKEGVVSYFPLLLDSLANGFYKIVLNTVLCHNVAARFRNKNNEVILWIHEGVDTFEYVAENMPTSYSDNIKVLCGGEYCRDTVKKYKIFHGAEILLYGVKDAYKEFRKKKNSQKIQFLLAGTFSKRKGQDILIKAIMKLPAFYLNKTTFFFMGSPFEEEISKEIQTFCLHWPNAHIIPIMGREKMFKLYEYMDAVISPSRDDPMPVVMTEAMMFHKICICSTQTGTASLIKDRENGFICEAENPQDLACCIMDIVDNEDRLEDIGKESRKIYDTYFVDKIFKRNLEKLFLPEFR